MSRRHLSSALSSRARSAQARVGGWVRAGRVLRVPRATACARAWARVSKKGMISCRSAEAEACAVPDHGEGDLLIGQNRLASGALVQKSSRFTMLVHLSAENTYGGIPRTKNGLPAGRRRRCPDGQRAQENRDSPACRVVTIINPGASQGTVRSRPFPSRVRRESAPEDCLKALQQSRVATTA